VRQESGCLCDGSCPRLCERLSPCPLRRSSFQPHYGVAFHKPLMLYKVISDFLKSLGLPAQLKYIGLPFASDRKIDSAVFGSSSSAFLLVFALSFLSPIAVLLSSPRRRACGRLLKAFFHFALDILVARLHLCLLGACDHLKFVG
jgi:hypothetical protein